VARRRVRLVAFDLDGTLVRGPTICEVLADKFGMRDRMRAIERLRNLEDISAAREEMLRWYGDAPLAELCAELKRVAIAPGAAEAFGLLAARGVSSVIVSVTWAFAVEWFARRFGAQAWVGTSVGSTGSIGHFWPHDKPVWLSRYASDLGIELDEVAAVGDSLGDVPMLSMVGHPIYVGAQLPAAIGHAMHKPNANLRELVAAVLGG
jgi:HAD superfamily phosphoserine phosphatase-like hydrolase